MGSRATRRSERLRAKATRDRKLERALVDPSTALVSADLEDHWDDDDMQGPSHQEVVHTLEDMAISPSLTYRKG